MRRCTVALALAVAIAPLPSLGCALGAAAPTTVTRRGGVAAAEPPTGVVPVELPTPGSPRADGKSTLVWFHKFECPPCEEMEQFAPQTFARYADRMAQVDFDVEDDASLARRFHIPGAPSFVLLDAAGRELTRFFYEPTPERLEARFARFLVPAPGSH
jgi:hypothetical protein